MNLNTLCNSANGTFVTLDDCLPDTGCEPNVMEFTDVMEFTGTAEVNNAASSDINFQDSPPSRSSDLYIADDEFGKLLAEVHRDCADYRRAEGVNVSQSSVSVMADRMGELVERRDSDHFPCSVRNVKSAQNQFLVITQAKRMVDRTGEPVEERIVEERESSNAQTRTMLDEQRGTIIAECSEKVLHHEFLAAQAEQDRRVLQEELLRPQQDFREVHQTRSYETEGIAKIPKFDFRWVRPEEVHWGSEDYCGIIWKTSRIAEWSNCMNVSEDFQDAESIHSGNSHVTSQPGIFPKHPPSEKRDVEAFIRVTATNWWPAKYLGCIRCVRKRFLQLHKLPLQFCVLKDSILFGRKLLENQFTCLLQRKVEDQSETQIWDASPDRQPQIQSSSVEESILRIMEQTNNDCRFRISV